jgi:2-hydroxy-6-oxonona-2,4-dienedioate hydrolase
MHIWRDDASRERLEAWHGRFRARIETPVVSEVVDTSFGSSHVLIAGLGEAPPLVCFHAMRTGSAHLLSELQSLATRFRLVASDVPGSRYAGPRSASRWYHAELRSWLADRITMFLSRPQATGP